MAASSFIVEGLVPYAVCFGTKAEIEAITPSTEYAIGNASDFGQMNFVRGRGWSTKQPGSPSSPFTTTAEFPTSAPYVGYEVCLAYSLAPMGFVRWYWTGTKFKLSPDQVLVNYENDDGSPIYDQTATLLTPGTSYDLWTSDVLPSWLLVAGFRGALTMEAGFLDLVSTASVTVRAGIGDNGLGGSDPNTSLLGFTSAAAINHKGFTMAPANFRISGGDIFAVAGAAPFTQGQNAPRSLFQTINSPRIRLCAIPGATTNRFRLWSATIKSGVC